MYAGFTHVASDSNQNTSNANCQDGNYTVMSHTWSIQLTDQVCVLLYMQNDASVFVPCSCPVSITVFGVLF